MVSSPQRLVECSMKLLHHCSGRNLRGFYIVRQIRRDDGEKGGNNILMHRRTRLFSENTNYFMQESIHRTVYEHGFVDVKAHVV